MPPEGSLLPQVGRWFPYLLLTAAGFFGRGLERNLAVTRSLPDLSEWSPVDILYGLLKLVRPVRQPQPGVREHFARQRLAFDLPETFEPRRRLIVGCGGDIMHSHGFSPEALDHVWDETGAPLFGADLVLANLETPLVPEQPPLMVPTGRRIGDFLAASPPRLNGDTLILDAFSGPGRHLDVVSTATNHCLNMGEEGLRRTLEVLDERGIAHTGTARSPEEQREVPVIERNGIRVGFVSATFSLNGQQTPAGREYLANVVSLNEQGADLSLVVRLIRSAREQGADFVVVSAHWGQDLEAFPPREVIENAHRIIALGADAIIGHHPHMLQPVERHTCADRETGERREGFIAYSLGELLSCEQFLPDSWLSALVRLHIVEGVEDGVRRVRLCGVDVLPVFLEWSCNGRYVFRQRLLDNDTGGGRTRRHRERALRHWEEVRPR